MLHVGLGPRRRRLRAQQHAVVEAAVGGERRLRREQQRKRKRCRSLRYWYARCGLGPAASAVQKEKEHDAASADNREPCLHLKPKRRLLQANVHFAACFKLYMISPQHSRFCEFSRLLHPFFPNFNTISYKFTRESRCLEKIVKFLSDSFNIYQWFTDVDESDVTNAV